MIYLVHKIPGKVEGRRPKHSPDDEWFCFTNRRRASLFLTVKRKLGYTAMMCTVTDMELLT